jgi:hypothetical protein
VHGTPVVDSSSHPAPTPFLSQQASHDCWHVHQQYKPRVQDVSHACNRSQAPRVSSPKLVPLSAMFKQSLDCTCKVTTSVPLPHSATTLPRRHLQQLLHLQRTSTVAIFPVCQLDRGYGRTAVVPAGYFPSTAAVVRWSRRQSHLLGNVRRRRTQQQQHSRQTRWVGPTAACHLSMTCCMHALHSRSGPFCDNLLYYGRVLEPLKCRKNTQCCLTAT